ncbi:hypothetical protein N7G274_009428 [Stereocaulon virgatum]|uniref:F-box domain-containing protein n=1 Tax=Stereocaulon virgatum TaxID=373712 RepID=A0ABR3ZYV7_9LECA
MSNANLATLPYEIRMKIVRCLLKDNEPQKIIRGVNVTAPSSFAIARVSKAFHALSMAVFYGENKFQYFDAHSLTFSAAQCDKAQIQSLSTRMDWQFLQDLVAGTTFSPQVAKHVLSIHTFQRLRHLDLYVPCSKGHMNTKLYRRRLVKFVQSSFPKIRKVTVTELSGKNRASNWLARKMNERNQCWGQLMSKPRQAEEKRMLKEYLAKRGKELKALRTKV